MTTTTPTTIQPLTTPADLAKARAGSYLTLIGTGGDLQDWVDGVTGMLQDEEIGTPQAWYQTTGAAVNRYAGDDVDPDDQFPDDLTFLLVPLDGLHIGRLAMFRLTCGLDARWFDDLIDNMRRH